MSNIQETKQQNLTNPKGAGRKWFDGKDEKEICAKLEQSAALDASIEEMCFYADISRFSLMRYLEKYTNFAQRIEKLRQKPILKARQRVVTGIEESYQNSMDYLKRKRKDEFGDNMKVGLGLDPVFLELIEKANKILPE